MTRWSSGFSSLRDLLTYATGIGITIYGLVVREAAFVVAGIGVVLGPPALSLDRGKQPAKDSDSGR